MDPLLCVFFVWKGLETVWGDETKEKLQQIFEDIIDNTEDVNIMGTDENHKPCMTFDNFINYFSPCIRSNFDDDDDNINKYEYRWKDWRDIKYAVSKSPLSRRNRNLREKENISAQKYRDKLNDIEKLIGLLEETVIFHENKTIKSKKKKSKNKKKNNNDDDNDKMLENEQLFWRKKILQHREFVRFYQDVILYEIINENNKMKTKIDKLIKLNKFSKKVQFEENEWYKKNQHLLQIEKQYYVALRKQKSQQSTMKKCEMAIQQKDQEISQLKSELLKLKTKINNDENEERVNKISGHNNNNINIQQNNNGNGGVLNHKLLKLKGEIAQKKLEIQSQLNIMTTNINDENDRLSFNRQERVKHDRI